MGNADADDAMTRELVHRQNEITRARVRLMDAFRPSVHNHDNLPPTVSLGASAHVDIGSSFELSPCSDGVHLRVTAAIGSSRAHARGSLSPRPQPDGMRR